MTLGLTLGCAFGAAVCLLVMALLPSRPRLAVQAARWSRQRERSSAEGGDSDPLSLNWFRAPIARQLQRAGLRLPHVQPDLEITDRTLEQYVASKFALGMAGLIGPAALVGVMAAAGVHPGLAVPVLASLVLAAVLFWLPDLSLTRAAAVRRFELRRALACYLDLVSMSLAGGRGVPEALPAAARIGTGWAFSLLQQTLDRARYVGVTPWVALAELGERLDVPELQDLGGSLQLVADDGAKVRASLAARASTQRRRQLAETEGEAAKADQSIQMAQVVLAVGFFLFLGFPAVVTVMGI